MTVLGNVGAFVGRRVGQVAMGGVGDTVIERMRGMVAATVTTDVWR